MVVAARRDSVPGAGMRDPRSAALSLARVEGRRTVRHPLVWAFAAVTVVGLLFNEGDVTLLATKSSVGLVFFPFCAGVLLATNLAVLRGRRHGTEESYAAAPAGMRTRTLGHLLSVAWPVALSLLLLGGWLAFEKATGALGWPSVSEVAIVPVLVAGAGASGVLVARWVPHHLGAYAALLLVGAVEGAVSSLGDGSSPLRWLAPWTDNPPGIPIGFWPRPVAWHLLYLAGLIGLVAAGALLRDGRSRRAVAAAVVAGSVAAGAGVAQTRPPSSGELQRVASRIVAPQAHQVCDQRGGVRYCAYRGYEPLVDEWASVVEGVTSRAPRARAPREVRQRVPAETIGAWRDLTGRALLPEPYLWPEDGVLRPELRWSRGGEADLALAVGAASLATGLPVQPRARTWTAEELAAHPPGEEAEQLRPGDRTAEPCLEGGTARAVIVLWLAGGATPAAEETLRNGLRVEPSGESAFDDGVEYAEGRIDPRRDAPFSIGPPSWVADMPTGVVWLRSDARYALQLLDRPAVEVAAALERDWARLTHPSTPVGELVRQLGLRPLEAPAQELPGEVGVPRCA